MACAISPYSLRVIIYNEEVARSIHGASGLALGQI